MPGENRIDAHRGFGAIVWLAFGFGSGGIALLLCILNATLLKPPSISRPGEVFSLVHAENNARAHSYPSYLDFRERARTFNLSLYRFVRFDVSFAPDLTQPVWGNAVSGNYFQLLGIKAAVGRMLSPEDDLERGALPVAVLTYDAWQRYLSGTPDVVRRVIKINGVEHSIIGVTGRDFSSIERLPQPEIFIPVASSKKLDPQAALLERRDSEQSFLLARLYPGVSQSRAEAEANAIANQIAARHSKNVSYGIRLVAPENARDLFLAPKHFLSPYSFLSLDLYAKRRSRRVQTAKPTAAANPHPQFHPAEIQPVCAANPAAGHGTAR
jgi:hypothetical protein